MGDRDGELLLTACLTLRDIAEAVGVPHTTVRNWSSGRIEMPSELRTRVATFMRAHAAKVLETAEELEE